MNSFNEAHEYFKLKKVASQSQEISGRPWICLQGSAFEPVPEALAEKQHLIF